MSTQLKSMAERGSLVFAQNVKLTQLARSGQICEAVKVFQGMNCRNVVTYNSMISAYAKNGRVVDARRLFDEMPARNLVSWNTMIAGYSHNDFVDEATDLFYRMPRRDVFSWTIMVTCYARNGELEKARYLFDRMPGEKTSVCYNAIISGYAKSRRFGEAVELLSLMPSKDLVSWNSVLAGYTQNGEIAKGWKFFEEMPERDVVSWNLMLEGFVRDGDLGSALELFDHIPSRNVVSWVTLLNGYCKGGRMVDARRLFDRMPEKNVVSWNAILAGYVQCYQIEEACKLFMEMPERNSVTWTTMINGYVRSGKLDEARGLAADMPFENVAAQTALISGYVQSMRMEDAWKIFKQINTPDLVCWNTMLSGYAQCGRMDKAAELFKRMPKKDVVSWNTMIAGYAQDGQMVEAVQIFREMPRKNRVSWNSVISGYTQNGFHTEALQHFVSMWQNGTEPDWSSFACGLSACANVAALQIGKQLHHLLIKTGHANDFYAGNALINMYARCGRISRARQVFDEMTTKDIVSWNSLIAGYALNGYGKETITVFHDMESSGCRPDEVTFVSILSACVHAGMVDEGLELFYSMTRNYSIKHVAEHFACVTDLLGRAGRLQEAFQLVSGMPFDANAGIWGALLGACRIHKKPELAKVAAEKLIEIEPHKTSNYVLLSNVYAEAGKWDEVERIRAMMKENRVRKQTGRSWIEIRNKVSSFCSDDSEQARTTQVCNMLNTLNAQMKDTEPKIDTLFEYG